jgi:prolipoprotein diacylglyceryltransferase
MRRSTTTHAPRSKPQRLRASSAINLVFDRLTTPTIRVGRWVRPAHGTLGVVGFLVAVVLGEALARERGLSSVTQTVVVAVCVASAYGVALGTKIVTGEERHRYLHYEIAFLVTVPVALWLLNERVLPYLDIALVGVGTVLAFGRLGCLMAGCCHGRPAGWGARYGEAHVATGLEPELAGVRLLPVQLFEAMLVFGVLAVGVALIVSRAPPGSAATWYVMSYGIGRFGLEYLRGDSARSYLGPFSWVQWTVLAIAATTVALEAIRAVPFTLWHVVALGAIAGVVLVTLLDRRRPADLWHPRHLRELAGILKRLDGDDGSADRLETTSLGMSVSAGRLEQNGFPVRLVTVSVADRPMTDRLKRRLARLIVRLEGAPPSYEVLDGRRGVMHVIVARGPAKSEIAV